MSKDEYTPGGTPQAPANTSPNVKTSQEMYDNSTAHGRNQTGPNEVTLEPCLRLLRRVLTRPDKKFD